jgi:hypothetical protein
MRAALAAQFGIPGEAIAFHFAGRPVKDDDYLYRLPKSQIEFSAEGYVAVPVRIYGAMKWLICHKREQIIEVLAFLQARAKRPTQLTLADRDGPLDINEIISHVLQKRTGLECKEGDPLSDDTSDVSFQWPSQPVQTFSVPSCWSVLCVLSFLAKPIGVSPRVVQLWHEQQILLDSELRSSGRELFKSHTSPLEVRPRVISVLLTRKRLAPNLVLNVRVFDRIFDVKLRLAQGAKFHSLQISKYGLVPRDDVRLATLGITGEGLEFQIDILDRAICSLCFENAGNVVRKHFQCEGRTFGDICGLFSAVPLTVGYEYQGKAVKKATPLDSQCWDSAFPIRVVKRDCLSFIFEQFPDRNIEVSLSKDIAIEDIKTYLLSRFRDFFSFRLYMGRSEAKSGYISQLNPDLEEPVVVKEIKLAKQSRFTFSGKEVAANWSKETATCQFAKAFLAAHMSCTVASVELFDSGRLLSDSAKLVESGNYQIRLKHVIRHFFVELGPKRKESWPPKSKFVKECEIDVGSIASAQAFVRHFTFNFNLGPITNARLMKEGPEIGMDALMVDFPDLCELALEWVMEVGSCCYNCQTSPNTWRPLKVSSSTTVTEMKFEFMRLTNHPSPFPGAVSISFLGTELTDSDLVLDYGIPDGSQLGVSNESRHFTVLNYDGENSTFTARRGDTLASLKHLYAEQNSINLARVAFFCGDRSLTDDEEFWDLPIGDIRIVHRAERIFVRTLRREKIPVTCDRNRTVDDAASQLAAHFCVALNQIRLTIPNRLLAATEPILAIKEQIACSLLSLWKSDHEREFFLFHEGALFVFRFNSLLTVADIGPILKHELKIGQAFSMVADRKVVDPAHPLSQLAEGLVLGFALPPWEGTIVLATDDSPQWIPLRMSPTATLAEVEMQLRAQQGLGEMEIQFSLSSDAEVIDKACQVGGIDAVLVARQKDCPEKYPGSSHSHSAKSWSSGWPRTRS